MTTTRSTSPRRRWRAVHNRVTVLFAAVTMLGTVACGGSDGGTGPGSADPTGLYSLRQVGRDAIPAEIFRGSLGGVPGVTVHVTGGELVLQDDDRFYLAVDFELRANGEAFARSQSVEGDYEIDGGRLVLAADGSPGATTATLRDGVIGLPMDLVGDGTIRHYNFRYVP